MSVPGSIVTFVTDGAPKAAIVKLYGATPPTTWMPQASQVESSFVTFAVMLKPELDALVMHPFESPEMMV